MNGLGVLDTAPRTMWAQKPDPGRGSGPGGIARCETCWAARAAPPPAQPEQDEPRAEAERATGLTAAAAFEPQRAATAAGVARRASGGLIRGARVEPRRAAAPAVLAGDVGRRRIADRRRAGPHL